MPRATRRKDGTTRITIRIEAHLTVTDAATAIALGSYEGPDKIAGAGPRQLLAWIREGTLDYGIDALAMGDISGYEDEYEAATNRLVEVGIFPAEP